MAPGHRYFGSDAEDGNLGFPNLKFCQRGPMVVICLLPWNGARWFT
jgi:hypothetical protein